MGIPNRSATQSDPQFPVPMTHWESQGPHSQLWGDDTAQPWSPPERPAFPTPEPIQTSPLWVPQHRAPSQPWCPPISDPPARTNHFADTHDEDYGPISPQSTVSGQSLSRAMLQSPAAMVGLRREKDHITQRKHGSSAAGGMSLLSAQHAGAYSQIGSTAAQHNATHNGQSHTPHASNVASPRKSSFSIKRFFRRLFRLSP